MSPPFIADKSALARMPEPSVRERLGPLIERGLVATCGVVDLEVLYSATARSYDDVLAERRSLPRLEMDESSFDRAIEMQRALAATSQHRVPIPDLLIAAVANRHGATVLHYDQDYERIAGVTDLRHSWIVPAGSI